MSIQMNVLRGTIMEQNKVNEMCDITVIHQLEVENAKENFPKDDTLDKLSNLFKVIGDSTRSKILYLLSKNEFCVCDISAVLQMTQSAISHQLRVLKEAKLVKNRREGKVVYYSLKDEHVTDIFNLAFIHINELDEE